MTAARGKNWRNLLSFVKVVSFFSLFGGLSSFLGGGESLSSPESLKNTHYKINIDWTLGWKKNAKREQHNNKKHVYNVVKGLKSFVYILLSLSLQQLCKVGQNRLPESLNDDCPKENEES